MGLLRCHPYFSCFFFVLGRREHPCVPSDRTLASSCCRFFCCWSRNCLCPRYLLLLLLSSFLAGAPCVPTQGGGLGDREEPDPRRVPVWVWLFHHPHGQAISPSKEQPRAGALFIYLVYSCNMSRAMTTICVSSSLRRWVSTKSSISQYVVDCFVFMVLHIFQFEGGEGTGLV